MKKKIRYHLFISPSNENNSNRLNSLYTYTLIDTIIKTSFHYYQFVRFRENEIETLFMINEIYRLEKQQNIFIAAF